MWLCTGISLVRYALQTRYKSQKTRQVFYSALKKEFFAWGCGCFVSNIICGGLLGHLGPLCLALGANRQVVVFRSSFYWKLGYNPSLLILWMTCWGFGFKSYDVS